MLLDQYIRDLKAFMDDFASALDAERTKFYLDTSILIWLIRLGSHARAEVFAWLRSRPTGSVWVPVWCAHELHRHILDDTAKKNLIETVSGLTKKYDDFVRMAAERADDTVCAAKGYASRSAFITDLELTTVRIKHLEKVVILEEDHLKAATKEVIDFVNERILNTNLDPIVRRLDRTGRFRVSHRMPPGFGDRPKEENSYGDIVIWEEIVRDIKRDAGNGAERDVVFITRDKKTDWISAASYVRDGKGVVRKSNRDEDMDVTEAHPLLVHELVGIAGGQRLYITLPGYLASVIDYGYRQKGQNSMVKEWLSATHKPELLPKLASQTIQVTPAPPQPASPAPSVPAPPAETAQSAAGPKDFIILSRAESGAYQRALPEEQPAMIENWVGDIQRGGITPVRLGCIFADLIVANAAGIREQVPAIYNRLLEMIDASKARDIALATIVAAYFDAYGDLRKTPDLALGSVALDLEKQDRFKEAFDTLRRFLKDANAELLYAPGAGVKQVKFVIDHADVATGAIRLIRQILLNDQAVVVDSVPETSKRTLSVQLAKERSAGCSGKDVRLLVSRQFLIPPECLSEALDNKKFTWQADAGLVTLDMTSPGGVSAGAEEEDENE